MANEKNLIPNSQRSPTEVRENGRKGGINSGKARNEKKTIRMLVDDILSREIADFPTVEKFAKKIGVETDKSIKEIFTIVCILNTMKNGRVEDLIKVSELLGECGNEEKNNGILDKIAEALKRDE